MNIETLPILEAHDDIGGIVRLEEPEHFDDIGVVEMGQSARFGEEALEPPLVVRLGPAGPGHDGAASFSRGQIRRHEFLDCYQPVEPLVACQIGDAKSTMSQYMFNTIIVQLVAVRQGSSVFGFRDQFSILKGLSSPLFQTIPAQAAERRGPRMVRPFFRARPIQTRIAACAHLHAHFRTVPPNPTCKMSGMATNKTGFPATMLQK